MSIPDYQSLMLPFLKFSTGLFCQNPVSGWTTLSCVTHGHCASFLKGKLAARAGNLPATLRNYRRQWAFRE